MCIRNVIIASLLLAVMVISGCEATKRTINQINAFPVSDDIKLGLQVSQEIASKPAEYPVLPEQSNQEVYRYVKGIRDKILSTGQIKHRSAFKWELKIIDDDKTLNAFVTPGGYIYIYTGLIKFLDSEDELAGVLGHEIAHADRRHATRQMTKNGAIGMLGQAVLGNKNAVGQVLGSLVGLKFSRASEEEADEYSVNYLCRTSYNAAGAAGFFVKLQGKGGAPPQFLSTHPSSGNRIVDIKTKAKNLGCRGSKRNVLEYSKIKAKL